MLVMLGEEWDITRSAPRKAIVIYLHSPYTRVEDIEAGEGVGARFWIRASPGVHAWCKTQSSLGHNESFAGSLAEPSVCFVEFLSTKRKAHNIDRTK